MWNPRTSLAAKWLIYQVLGFSLILGISLAVQYQTIRQQIYGDVRNTANSVVQVLQEIFIDNPQLLNAQSLDITLDRFVAQIPGIHRIQVHDANLVLIADSGSTASVSTSAETVSLPVLQAVVQDGEDVFIPYQAAGRDFYQVVRPIHGKYDPARKSTVHGVISIHMHLSNADRKVRQTFEQTVLIISGLFVLFLMLQYGLMQVTFLRPLGRLTQAIKQFGQREDTERVAGRSYDELGHLVNTFRQMARDIEQTQAELELEIAERIEGEEERLRLADHIRQLLESSGEGIYGIDMAGRCTFINRIGAEMLGYAPEELLGRDMHKLIHHCYPDGKYYPIEACAIFRAITSGAPSHVEDEMFWRCDGSGFAVAYSAHPLLDGSEIQGAVVTFRDITEQKRTQKAAFQLAAIVESTEDAILSKKLDGTIMNWNKGAEQLYGYTAREIVGRSVLELFPAHQSHEFTLLREKILRGESVQHYETVRIHKDGTPIDVALTMSQISDVDGRIIGISTIARDNSMRKQAERELKRAKEAAEAADRAKSEFLANMSHEIRTPLNGIIGLTDLLMERNLPPEELRYMDVIRQSGETLLTVINDILDFSKIEAGKLNFEVIDFQLLPVVEESVNMFAERAAAKGVELTCHVHRDVPTALRGDPFRLSQILINLIGNAIKFTDQGDVLVQVQHVEDRDRTAVLRFEVIDTGIGLTLEQQERLFQPFSQADASTTRKYGGTGLGLAISTQLVHLLGGAIGLQSTPGSGSLFWFTMPLEQQPDHDQSAPEELAELRGLKLLVVDDNPVCRSALQQQILAWGVVASASAADGPEALAMLREAAATGQPYDVVLLDMDMPNMDGGAVARAIKAAPALAKTTIIMLTPAGLQSLPQPLQESGISLGVAKPTRQSELYEQLVGALSRIARQPEVQPETAPALAVTPAPPHINPRLLVVEDNVINQQVIVGILKAAGYHPDVVANGREALVAISHSSYAAVLMDCQMPEMDGYETTSEIRRREGSTRHTPIIAMTANALPGQGERCLAAGMDDYLVKPARAAQIYAALERWIGSSALGSTPASVDQQRSQPGDSLLDPTILSNLRGLQPANPGFLDQLIDMFVQDTTARLADLRALLVKGDAGQLVRAAHTLIGSCANMGVRPMVELCQQIELLAQSSDMEQIAVCIDQLELAFGQACAALNQERST